MADAPVRSGYLEGTLGISTLLGPVARLELGARPLVPLALFAFGQWSPFESMAGTGFRVAF